MVICSYWLQSVDPFTSITDWGVLRCTSHLNINSVSQATEVVTRIYGFALPFLVQLLVTLYTHTVVYSVSHAFALFRLCWYYCVISFFFWNCKLYEKIYWLPITECKDVPSTMVVDQACFSHCIGQPMCLTTSTVDWCIQCLYLSLT